MTTSVELRGGPLDGQVMTLSIAEYRQMMRFQGAEISGYVEAIPWLDLEIEEVTQPTRRTGRYRIPDHRDNVADFIGNGEAHGTGTLPHFRDWPR